MLVNKVSGSISKDSSPPYKWNINLVNIVSGPISKDTFHPNKYIVQSY